MTGNDCIIQIEHLGYRENLKAVFEEKAIYTAINRSLCEVNAIDPVVCVCNIAHSPPVPCACISGIILYRPGNGSSIEAAGAKAVSFRAGGSGSAVLSCGDDSYTFTWSAGAAPVVLGGNVATLLGRTPGDSENVKLTFGGTSSYIIDTSALFSEESDGVIDCGYYTDYDMGAVSLAGSRFGGFASDPLPGYDNYTINGTHIGLVRTEPGIYGVRYERIPDTVTADNKSDSIDVKAYLESLVPLRAAYYLWMASEPEASAVYQRDYERQEALARIRRTPRAPRGMKSLNGW